jgi:hypothetical protein
MLRSGFVQCLEVSKGAEVTNSKRSLFHIVVDNFYCSTFASACRLKWHVQQHVHSNSCVPLQISLVEL